MLIGNKQALINQLYIHIGTETQKLENDFL